MRNRAKCKKCKSVIESFHLYDYVSCKCGEISISGGNDKYECSAKDWKNFRRVDEQDNEIEIKIKDKDDNEKDKEADNNQPMKKEDLINELKRMIMRIEELPSNAMNQPITHYDFLSGLMLIAAILESDK